MTYWDREHYIRKCSFPYPEDREKDRCDCGAFLASVEERKEGVCEQCEEEI